MLLSLGDPSERAVSATHQVFIPAFAAWCTELGNLQSQLIPSLLTRIEKLLKVKTSLWRPFFLISLFKLHLACFESYI